MNIQHLDLYGFKRQLYESFPIKGEIKGTIKTLVGLVLDGLISIAEASKRANMSEDEFKKYLK